MGKKISSIANESLIAFLKAHKTLFDEKIVDIRAWNRMNNLPDVAWHSGRLQTALNYIQAYKLLVINQLYSFHLFSLSPFFSLTLLLVQKKLSCFHVNRIRSDWQCKYTRRANLVNMEI